MKRGLIVTIDGPTDAGKSTVAQRLARRLNFTYLDTGAIYRAITLKALRLGILPSQPEALARMINQTGIVFKPTKTASGRNIRNQPRLLLDNQDVTELVKQPWVTENVFYYAELPLVRKPMTRLQRRLGAKGLIVAEGKDLSSVVFPDAEIKVYLDATPEVRAQRRLKVLRKSEALVRYYKVFNDLKAHDRRDKIRKFGPLKITPEVIYVDTTYWDINRVVNRLLKIVRKSNNP